MIEDNFEKHFWIPEDSQEWKNYAIEGKFVQQKGIYKDIFGCSKPQSDYQLRPNFVIAMAVSPSMFNEEHGRIALGKVEANLYVSFLL